MSLADRVLGDLRRQAALLVAGGPTSGLAFRTALATVLSVLAALALHLDSPDWAGITALAIVQKDVAATLARSLDRAAGTVVGAVVGFIGVGVVDDHLLFGALCVAAVTLGLYGEARVTHGYAMLLGGLTAMLVLFGALDAPEQALTVAVYRAWRSCAASRSASSSTTPCVRAESCAPPCRPSPACSPARSTAGCWRWRSPPGSRASSSS